MNIQRVATKTEFDNFADSFALNLAPLAAARVVAISGELGAGKTTFVQGVARALGITETVNSPTFVIQKTYELTGSFKKLVHIDAYRLKEERELEVLGWNELVSDPGNLILIEWPEKVPGLIPRDAIRVRFDIEGDGRIITIDGQESSQEKA